MDILNSSVISAFARRFIIFYSQDVKVSDFLCKFVFIKSLCYEEICLLLILSVGLWETEMFAQRMSINCSNSTGANLDVTVVLKSPEGKSTSFSGNKLESKSFDCELTERGEYSLTVIFKESGSRKPIIPFGTCKFTVTGAESSLKADASCSLADMVIPCESLNMSAQPSAESRAESSMTEYSNRRQGTLVVRKFYPQSNPDNIKADDNITEKTSANITEKTSAWNISVISLAE